MWQHREDRFSPWNTHCRWSAHVFRPLEHAQVKRAVCTWLRNVHLLPLRLTRWNDRWPIFSLHTWLMPVCREWRLSSLTPCLCTCVRESVCALKTTTEHVWWGLTETCTSCTDNCTFTVSAVYETYLNFVQIVFWFPACIHHPKLGL